MRTGFIAIILVFSSCASTTVIRSSVDAAVVRKDGLKVGTTPYTLSDTSTVLEKTLVTVEKEGYEPQTIGIARNRWNSMLLALSVGAGLSCLPGVGFLGLLWSADYPPEYRVELTPRPGTPPPPADPAVPAPQ